MNLLKQSTAYTFRLGPFVDSTDGDTEENSLTIAAADVLLSKAGGALTAKNDATALTGTGADAHYTCVLDATDTNTLGTLRAWAHISGALPVWKDFVVVTAQVYNSLVAGSDLLDVNASQLGGTAQTGNDVGADVNAILADTGTDGVLLAATADSAALVDSVWDEVISVGDHAVTGSAAEHLRAVIPAVEGTVDDVTPNTTDFTTDLAGGYANDFFNDQMIVFTDGDLSGQTRPILNYIDATGEIEVEEAWTSAPANGDSFVLVPNHIHTMAALASSIATAVMASVAEAEGSYTVQQILSIALAVLAGETTASGATLKTPDGAATRVAATINASAERTAMTLTPSA